MFRQYKKHKYLGIQRIFIIGNGRDVIFYLQIVKNIPATVNRIESDVNVFSVVAKRVNCNGDQRLLEFC